MTLPRLLPLIALFVYFTSCKLDALCPPVIFVSGENTKTPYRLDGDHYTGEQLKQKLTEWVKATPWVFSRSESGEYNGLGIAAEENVSFSTVMKLLQILKESGVAEYWIRYDYKENPTSAVALTLPLRSDQLSVARTQLDPAPPVDDVSPQQRIKEITEKMGGRPGK